MHVRSTVRMSFPTCTAFNAWGTFTVASAVYVALLALAVVAVAVGAFDDAGRALSVVTVAVTVAALGLVEVQGGQEEGDHEEEHCRTVHLGDLCGFY